MGIRDALERIINIFLIFMIVCLGFVMRCELFHITIYDEIYNLYANLKIDYDENQLADLKTDLKSMGNDGDLLCYPLFTKKSELETELDIYVNNDKAKEIFIKETGIKEKKYESLLNGNLSVFYKNIEELADNNTANNSCFLLLNNESSAKEKLSLKYNVMSLPKAVSNEEDMIIIVWTLIGIMIFIISLILVFRRKKEFSLRAVYGESLASIVAKSFVLDLISYELIYLFARIFVFNFISGDYKSKLAFFIYQLFIIAAALTNFLVLKLNIRAIFSNVNDNKNAIYFLYFIKIIAFSLVLFSLVTNISSVDKNTFNSSQKNKIESIENDVFITDTSLNLYDDGIWNKLDASDLNIKLCMKISDGKNPYVFVSESAIDLLPDYIKNELENNKSDGDIVLIHSNKAPVFSPDIEGILSMNDLENLHWDELSYNENVNMLCIANGQYNRFENVKNPTIIYLKENVEIPKQLYLANRAVIYGHTEVTIREILKKNGIDNQLIISRVGDIYDYQISFIKRLVSFLSSLCVLVLILELTMIVWMLRMEFREYAMEHAIRELVGQGFFERNRYLIFKMNIGNLLAIIVVVGIAVFMGTLEIKSTIIIGLILDIVENLTIAAFILRQEKLSMIKTLKGGCL